MSGLAVTASRGLRWTAVSQAARRGTQLVTLAVLAHFMPAREIGLLGMATGVLDLALSFRDLGLATAIIQRDELDDQLLSSVFWAQLGFGVLGSVLIWLSAPLVAAFYGEPRLVLIIGVLSLTFTLACAGSLHQGILERRLAFEKVGRAEIFSALFGAAFGIGAGLMGAGVWSLIIQSLTTQAGLTLWLWVQTRWVPARQFQWSDIRGLFPFGLHMTGSSLLDFAMRNADYILIGRFLGAEALGYYSLAFRMVVYPMLAVTQAVHRVLFPMASRLRNNEASFTHAYLRGVTAIALITAPMAAGLAALRKPFVAAVLGPNWAPTIPLLLILVPLGFSQSVGGTTGTIFQAQGRTDLMFRWGLIVCLGFIAAVAVGIPWGITGVALSITLFSVAVALPELGAAFRLFNLSLRTFIGALAPAISAATIMGAVLAAAVHLVGDSLPSAAVLAAGVALGSALFAVALWLLHPELCAAVIRLVIAKREPTHDPNPRAPQSPGLAAADANLDVRANPPPPE